MKSLEFIEEYELVGMMWIQGYDGLISFQVINTLGEKEGSWETFSVEGEELKDTVKRVCKLDDSYIIEHYKTINYNVWEKKDK